MPDVLAHGAQAADADLPRLIRANAEPLPEINDAAFGPLFGRAAEARVVLLGEASHGTSEFYRARARITEQLVREHGFNIVAVEADWPDAAAIDRYVRHRPPARAPERPFARFPTWMWRNVEVRDFTEWLRTHNAPINDPARRVGFYGLDLYSLHGSIAAVLEYLDRADPELARRARAHYACFDPWQDPAAYGHAATGGHASCEREVLAALREILDRRLVFLGRDADAFLDATQNARLIAAAEEYYCAMYYGAAKSWNLRDTHMFETMRAVLDQRGPEAKAVVWAHNSHIGNAAATEMGQAHGETNIGQLCRAHFGPEAYAIGFGTDRGTVAAASFWDGPMEIKTVRPARADSYEGLCREAGGARFLLDLRRPRDPDLVAGLSQSRLQRAIGVIYRPDTERMSHYFGAVLPRQFDAYVWFAETQAVTPLQTEPERREDLPETYPFGV
jgi:erythromycin esterase-like protein